MPLSNETPARTGSRLCSSQACAFASMRSSVSSKVIATSAVQTAAIAASVTPPLITGASATGFVSLPMPDNRRARQVVNCRHSHIHDEHGECNAVGIAAPPAYAPGQETNAEPVNKSAPCAGGGRYGIRGDEKCAQDRCSCKQVKAGARVRARADEVHQRCGHEKSQDDTEWNLPAND